MADYSPVLEICKSLFSGKSRLESEIEERFKKMRPADEYEVSKYFFKQSRWARPDSTVIELT